MKKYYYTYQITNLVNNKIYVGVHETFNLEDGYMGSGKVIRAAIEKHGIINFRKDILEYFDDSESMYAREKEIVTDEFLLREDTYNLRRGGTGGFDYININRLNIKLGKTNIFSTTSEYANSIFMKQYMNNEVYRKEHSEKISNALKLYYGGENNKGSFYDKTHSDETKRVMSDKAKERMKIPSNNSQYGTMWITDGINNKKIKKDSIIPDGWYKGRK